MGTDLSWLYETGLDIETGMSYTGGEDKYLSALRRFYKNHKKNRDRVCGYLEAGSIRPVPNGTGQNTQTPKQEK